jgi:hypothetical protein
MYHYVRAIAARHAFDTARQSLMSGFDEMRKRVSTLTNTLHPINRCYVASIDFFVYFYCICFNCNLASGKRRPAFES